MKHRWLALLWPLLGIAIGFAASAWHDHARAEAGPSWDKLSHRWVTESKDGLLFWKQTTTGSMQVTEYYLGEYEVPGANKDAPPTIRMGVFQRSYLPAPQKTTPLRRYREVIQQRSAPMPAPPAPEAPASCGGSCGTGCG